MRAGQPVGFQFPKAAVIFPTHAASLLASTRDLTLSAHAEGLTLGLQRAGFKARAYTTGSISSPTVQSVGPMWSLQTLRELLHELQEFVPDVIIIEHAPLAFGRELFVPATIAMWARSHRIELCTISHPEPGGRAGGRNERVASAMRTCGALFAHSFAIVTHDRDWAQNLRSYLPEASDHIDVYGAWPLVEPSLLDENALAAAAAKPFVPKAMASMKFPSTLGVNENAHMKLALVLDGVLPIALERVLKELEPLPSRIDVTLLAPFSAPAVVQRYESAVRELEGASSLSLLGDELTIKHSGRTLSFSQPVSRTELSRLLLDHDVVVEVPAKNAAAGSWSEIAKAHGNTHFRMTREAAPDGIANVSSVNVAMRVQRMRAYVHESCWRTIAKRIGTELHLGTQPIEPAFDLFSAAQERVEESTVSIRETA